MRSLIQKIYAEYNIIYIYYCFRKITFQEIMEKKQITPEIENGIKSAMAELLGYV